MIEPTTIVAAVVAEGVEATPTAEQFLWNACLVHSTRDVERLLREEPGLDVNWGNPTSFLNTPLHLCSSDENTDIIKMLLAHPRIDVNRKNAGGWSPLLWACKDGRLDSVMALLQDCRVDVNSANIEGATSVWLCAFRGWADIARWLVVTHGEHLDVGIKTNDSHLAHPNTSSIEISQRDDAKQFWDNDSTWWHRLKGRREVQSLLLRFCADRKLATFEARLELYLKDAEIAKVFSLVVLRTDGYLRVRPVSWSGGKGLQANLSLRFFLVLEKLPIELQMVVCHRVFSSNRSVILGYDAEMGFRHCLKRYIEEEEQAKAKKDSFGCIVS